MQNKRKNMVPAGVPEQAGTPEQTAADLPLTDSDEQLYTVTVDGQTVELTLEQLIAAAEQGLSKANRAARREQVAGEQPGGNAYQAFLDEYNKNQPTYRRITGLVVRKNPFIRNTTKKIRRQDVLIDEPLE